MDVFATMMASSQKAATKSAEEKTKRVSCPNCSATFPNTGAMAQHTKHRHKSKVDTKKHPKLNFPVVPKAQSNDASRPPAKRPRQPSSPQKQNRNRKKQRCSHNTSPRKKAKTRRRFSNQKKYSLILAYEALRQEDPLNCDMSFEMDHPSVSIETLRRWIRPKARAQIKKDGLSPNVRIREANVSANAMKRYHQGAFPKEEHELYDMFGNRRADAKRVTSKWLRAKMRHLVNKRVETEEAAELHTEEEKQKREALLQKAKNFRASRGWFRRWKRRFQVTLRRRTNKKTKSAQERLPKVQKFHRTVKRFCQPPPAQDAKYGRFRGNNRFHVDQVPLEFGGAEMTYEKKGAKRVNIKRTYKTCLRPIPLCAFCRRVFRASARPSKTE